MMPLIRSLAVLFAAGLSAACSDSSAEGSGNGSDAAKATPRLTPAAPERAAEGALPVSLGPPECNRCLSEHCDLQVAACAADAKCASLLVCISGCSSAPEPPVCFGGCLMAGDNPPQEFFAFLDCIPAQCETECGMRVMSD